MQVRIPSPLLSYTAGVSCVDVGGSTLGDVLTGLERRYPGMRFRIIDEQDRVRRHIRIFIDGEEVEDLARVLQARAAIDIVAALSGG